MQKLTIDMPVISKCTIGECAYNQDKQCHAKAITIGDFSNPGCDTFFVSSHHTQRIDAAGVGACKVADCQYNNDFECGADSIQVGKKNGQVNCLTYKKQR